MLIDYILLLPQMNFETFNYLLLYFKSDKTFDIRNIHQTTFNESDLQQFRKGDLVRVKTTYDDSECLGVIVQIGEDRQINVVTSFESLHELKGKELES